MHINKDAIAPISTAEVMYIRHMSAINDILLNAVDMPLVFEYGDPRRGNSDISHNSKKAASIMILNLGPRRLYRLIWDPQMYE